jgi:nitric oxide reductase activation protein
MSKISKQVKDYFGEVNTSHTTWALPEGRVIDLSKDNVSEKDLRRLAVMAPKLFVAKKASKPSAATTLKTKNAADK